MNIPIPFKQSDKILEIGGGESPIYHPNLDVRPMPTVDIVHDFIQPLPFTDASWNGIFSKFCLEHITLYQLKKHLKDVYRCLCKDGWFVCVTANLVEQAKYIINHKFDEDSSAMIFGGKPDYVHNFHHVGFSPSWICELMREAGFETVIVAAWVHSICDMIIEARK